MIDGCVVCGRHPRNDGLHPWDRVALRVEVHLARVPRRSPALQRDQLQNPRLRGLPVPHVSDNTYLLRHTLEIPITSHLRDTNYVTPKRYQLRDT